MTATLALAIALDRHWEGDEILEGVLIYAARLRLAKYCNARIFGIASWTPAQRSEVTQNAHFSLLTHTKQLLLETL